MKILTIANRKGGAGKSTCAAHIALEAVKAGKNVILIDLDPQKTLESWWSKRTLDNPSLADATYKDLSSKIEMLRLKGFDLCIIDTPGDTSNNAMAGIAEANLVLVPSKATAPDLTAIGRTIATLEENKKSYTFLLTQTIPGSRNSLQAVSVLSEFGPVAPTSLSNRVAYSNAMGAGHSAAEENKSASEELSKIWKYLDEKIFVRPTTTKKKVS